MTTRHLNVSGPPFRGPGSRSGHVGAHVAFAAGALLTMLTDDLIPEAREESGIGAGLWLVLGFAIAFALHQAGA